MKIHNAKLVSKGIAAVLALAVPGLGWAADHLLSLTTINTTVCPTPGITQVQAGVVNGSTGAVTTAPLILSGLQDSGSGCGGGSLNNNVNFTGTLTLERANVKLCKPGTKGNLEWLDQGSAIIGANGSLNASVGNGGNLVTYRVVVPVGTATIQNVSGSCAQSGANNVTVTRAATTIIKNPTTTPTTLATASIIVPLPNNSVPEPGTIALLGVGLAGLGWMGAKRARKARANSV